MSVQSQQTGEGDVEEHDNDSLVPSNSSVSDRDLWKFFAQRAADPDVKERRAKGAFVFQKRGFEEGQHFYEKEEQPRLKMSADRDIGSGSGIEDIDGERDTAASERLNRGMRTKSGTGHTRESMKHDSNSSGNEEPQHEERPRTADTVHRKHSVAKSASLSDAEAKTEERSRKHESKNRKGREWRTDITENEHGVSDKGVLNGGKDRSPDMREVLPGKKEKQSSRGGRVEKEALEDENAQSGSGGVGSDGGVEFDPQDGVSHRISRHLRRESSDMHKARFHDHSDASTHTRKQGLGGKSNRKSSPPLQDSASDASVQESRKNRRQSRARSRSMDSAESERSSRTQSSYKSYHRERTHRLRSESRQSRKKRVEYYSSEEDEEDRRTRRRASSRPRSSADRDSDRSSRHRSARRKRQHKHSPSGSESSGVSEPRRRRNRSVERRHHRKNRSRESESPSLKHQERSYDQHNGHKSRPGKGGADNSAEPTTKDVRLIDSRQNEHKQRNRWQPPPDRNFIDDLSEWGKSEIPDFYDSERATSTNTLSSGLSPRDTKPAALEWDPESARRTLAYNAGLYGAAQTMRRQGQVAGGPLTLTEDLPSRLAYQQLNALAGMAGKVQDAILHNKKIFEQRLLLADMALKQRGLDAWRMYRKNRKTKEQVLQRAVARITRGLLARAYFTWKDKFHLVDKDLQMRRKVNATINRGLVKRCFQEWQEICKEHAWKRQIRMREREVKALESKIRGYERRPIVVLKYRKMKECFRAWLIQSDRLRRKKSIREKAGRHFKNVQYLKAWNSWCAVVEECKRRSNLIKKATARIQNVKIASAMTAWQAMVEINKEKRDKIAKAVGWWKHAMLARAWTPLVEHSKWKKEKRQICNRWKNPFMVIEVTLIWTAACDHICGNGCAQSNESSVRSPS